MTSLFLYLSNTGSPPGDSVSADSRSAYARVGTVRFWSSRKGLSGSCFSASRSRLFCWSLAHPRSSDPSTEAAFDSRWLPLSGYNRESFLTSRLIAAGVPAVRHGSDNARRNRAVHPSEKLGVKCRCWQQFFSHACAIMRHTS